MVNADSDDGKVNGIPGGKVTAQRSEATLALRVPELFTFVK